LPSETNPSWHAGYTGLCGRAVHMMAVCCAQIVFHADKFQINYNWGVANEYKELRC
jgi:hypothetical protein